jgi:hypothetical protein
MSAPPHGDQAPAHVAGAAAVNDPREGPPLTAGYTGSSALFFTSSITA